ncbi:uncharacterized protein BDR25DRAFT_344685 [Lindgomyces ingoldianus]|uniref:Uncharacterized protein n=1 Tax=Lindgomyces ingoldianus TaxID=673940 RepID=A0ACB6QP95_9PLEO|nr:uncharacterized protein BDR25DRAFT_344685 [Lindgomyces ingoldianus]KAF2467976.1 hypothetical protein BDR25DRAFT_344685 [Lindgomyces ingoldianus]
MNPYYTTQPTMSMSAPNMSPDPNFHFPATLNTAPNPLHKRALHHPAAERTTPHAAKPGPLSKSQFRRRKHTVSAGIRERFFDSKARVGNGNEGRKERKKSPYKDWHAEFFALKAQIESILRARNEQANGTQAKTCDTTRCSRPIYIRVDPGVRFEFVMKQGLFVPLKVGCGEGYGVADVMGKCVGMGGSGGEERGGDEEGVDRGTGSEESNGDEMSEDEGSEVNGWSDGGDSDVVGTVEV